MGTTATRTLNMATLGEFAAAGVHVFRVGQHHSTMPHDHLFHEIVLVERGAAHHVTAEGQRRLRPGDVIFIRPRIWHAYHDTERFTIINCLIDVKLLRQFGPTLTRAPRAFDLFLKRCRDPQAESPTVLHTSPAQRAALVECLERVMAEANDQRPGWEVVTMGAAMEVIGLAARLGEGVDDDQPPLLPDRSQQAVMDASTILEQRFDQDVDLKHLARQVHLSPGHLSRMFSRRMGMGVIDFVHTLRCEEACRLLRFTDQSIGEIAREVGYAEVAYFSRRFRKQMNVSPREYRQRLAPSAMITGH